MRNRPQLAFFLSFDVLVSALVIATVIALLVMTVGRTRKWVEVSAAAVETLTIYRMPVSLHYALSGEWPKTMDEVRQWYDAQSNWSDSSRLRELLIEDGAITTGLRSPLAGERLTVHPAVTADDPLGPVRWVAGPGGHRGNWTVIGTDHTTVQDEFVPVLLKR
jgi:hypothetical protein